MSNTIRTVLLGLGIALIIVFVVVASQWDFFFPPAMTLTSSAFSENGIIPVTYTCDGQGIHPPLAVTGLPKGTVSMALFVYDPDAPHGFVHWVLYNISPHDTKIAEKVDPQGSVEGINSTGKTGYAPLCPPSGTHHYQFTIYALDQIFPFVNPPDMVQLKKVMMWHVLGKAVLQARYDHRS